MPGLHVKFVYNRAIVLSCFSFSVNELKRKIYYLAKISPNSIHSLLSASTYHFCKHCRYLLAFHCCFAYYHIIIIVLVVTIAIIILLTITTKTKNNNKNDNNNKIITIIIIKLWGTFEFEDEDVGFIATRTALRNA